MLKDLKSEELSAIAFSAWTCYVGHNVVMLISDTNIRETCCLVKVTSLFILQLLLLLVYVQFHSVVRFIQIESYMYFSCLFSPKTVVSHFRSHILL